MTHSSRTAFDLQKCRPRHSPADILRRAWREGHEIALDQFVENLNNLSPGDIAELIRIDLNARWNRSDRERPERYLGCFSAVAADAELAVDVIYAEYLAREQSGEQPEIAEYQTRFPMFAQALAEQIRLHLAIDTLDDEDANPG